MYDDKKRHRTAFSEATIPPCRHWRYACCMTLIRRETLCTMSSSCCCRQRCRGLFLGSCGTAVGLSCHRFSASLAKNRAWGLDRKASIPNAYRLGDTSGAFSLRWSEPKSWATAPLNRLSGACLVSVGIVQSV